MSEDLERALINSLRQLSSDTSLSPVKIDATWAKEAIRRLRKIREKTEDPEEFIRITKLIARLEVASQYGTLNPLGLREEVESLLSNYSNEDDILKEVSEKLREIEDIIRAYLSST